MNLQDVTGEWIFHSNGRDEKLFVDYPTKTGKWNVRFENDGTILQTISAADLQAWSDQGVITRPPRDVASNQYVVNPWVDYIAKIIFDNIQFPNNFPYELASKIANAVGYPSGEGELDLDDADCYRWERMIDPSFVDQLTADLMKQRKE